MTSAPSPDAASVKPACLYCGSEMASYTAGAGYSIKHRHGMTCETCFAKSPLMDSPEAALAAASRPAHPARELTDVQMEGCVHVGLNEISAEQFSMSWVRGSKGEKNINEIRAAIRAAVARALAIVRGEP